MVDARRGQRNTPRPAVGGPPLSRGEEKKSAVPAFHFYCRTLLDANTNTLAAKGGDFVVVDNPGL